MYTHMYVYMYIHVSVFTSIYVYIYIHIHIYPLIYIYTFLYTYIYTFLYIQGSVLCTVSGIHWRGLGIYPLRIRGNYCISVYLDLLFYIYNGHKKSIHSVLLYKYIIMHVITWHRI